MNADVLKKLMAGEYLCSVRFPNEFKLLESEANQNHAGAWLRGINMRLARIGVDGAWFMSPEKVTADMVTTLKGEFQNFRSIYGPFVRMLDFIRQTDVENPQCSPGDRIQLVELETRVIASTTLTSQLRALVDVIYKGSARVDDRENIRRLMEHLRKDGYVMLLDAGTGTYQVTGKIEQLYSVLAFLDDNKAIEEAEADDQMDLPDEFSSSARTS